MGKYSLSPYGIDNYLYAVNNSAWKMLNSSSRTWYFGTEPVYPLRWYIASGRASTPFLKSLLTVRPDVIARILIVGGTDQEIVDRIRTRVEGKNGI